ncbi:MAG TPA: ABC transporter ATP-binding protein [Saprospiraceae bacterium]|nr:ABC transporter ATP-binding protein [Saprospiraceae bacterium]
MKHLFRLNKYFSIYKWHFLLGIFFVTGSNYFGILIPQKVRDALNLVESKLTVYNGLSGSDKSIMYDDLGNILLTFGLIVTGFAILKGLFMYFMRQTIIVMSRLIEYDLRKEVFGHLTSLDQSFYRKNQTGDIMARISEDVSKVRNYLGPGILYGINLISLFVMTIYAMWEVDHMLTIVSLLPLPLLSISIYYVSKLINEKSTLIQQQLSSLNNTAQETYSGIRVVKSYVKEDQFVSFFEQQSEEFKKRSLKLAQIEAYFQPLMLLLISISTLIVVIVGGYQVFEGKLTTGNIAEFIIYVNMLTWPVTSIGWIASVVQEAEASQARINELMDQKSTLENTNQSQYTLNGNIEFKNVSFVYPNTGIKALDNVSFSIKKGEKLAILGKTASGKTTIAELLTRMFDVTSGEIFIDGVNIKSHNLNVLRNRIAYVPQDVFLFSDTIAANIAFGKPDVSESDIHQYAKHASVYEEIIKLPAQFDTLIGERGVTLSGGQKQRISIARAFIKNPDIIILDDALSAVDTKTEQDVLSFFASSLQGKSSITITHRANNLLNYDKIIILEEGIIIDEGTHDELLSREGFYSSIYDQQSMKEVL